MIGYVYRIQNDRWFDLYKFIDNRDGGELSVDPENLIRTEGCKKLEVLHNIKERIYESNRIR